MALLIAWMREFYWVGGRFAHYVVLNLVLLFLMAYAVTATLTW